MLDASRPVPEAEVAVPARTVLSGPWLRVLISGALLALLLTRIDLAQVWETVRRASPAWLLALLGLELFQRFFAAYRWFLLVRVTNRTASFASAVRVCFTSNFVGQFLPGIVGIEALRVYGLARSTSDLATSFSSVLVDRLLGSLGLLLMVFVGLSSAPPELKSEIAVAAWISLGALVAAGGVLLHPPSRRAVERLLPRRLSARIETRLLKLYARLDAYRDHPWLMLWALVLAVSFQLVRIALVLVAARALRLDLDARYVFLFLPIISFLGMLPISAGGLGVRESGFVYFFGTHGVAAPAAFALSLLGTLTTLASSLPGAYWAARGVPARASPARASSSPAGLR